MKKQELIHLHGLLYEVATYFRDVGDGDPDLRRYRELGTRPTSIYRAKPEHERAVFALAEATTTAMTVGDGAARSTPDESAPEAEAEPDPPARQTRIRPWSGAEAINRP